jgi:hypothetical protein
VSGFGGIGVVWRKVARTGLPTLAIGQFGNPGLLACTSPKKEMVYGASLCLPTWRAWQAFGDLVGAKIAHKINHTSQRETLPAILMRNREVIQ